MNIHKKNRYYAVCLVLLWTLPYIPAIRQRIVAYFWAEPLYWLGIFALIYAVLPRVYAPRKLSMRDEILGCAVFGAFFCLALHFILAVLLKRLRSSPYDLRPTGIALNILQLVPMLLAREYIREYALAAGKGYRKNILWPALLFGILFACSDISFAAIGALRSGEELFVYVMQDIVPALLNSLLLTLFCLVRRSGGCLYLRLDYRFVYAGIPFFAGAGLVSGQRFGTSFSCALCLVYSGKIRDGKSFHFLLAKESESAVLPLSFGSYFICLVQRGGISPLSQGSADGKYASPDSGGGYGDYPKGKAGSGYIWAAGRRYYQF